VEVNQLIQKMKNREYSTTDKNMLIISLINDIDFKTFNRIDDEISFQKVFAKYADQYFIGYHVSSTDIEKLFCEIDEIVKDNFLSLLNEQKEEYWNDLKKVLNKNTNITKKEEIVDVKLVALLDLLIRAKLLIFNSQITESKADISIKEDNLHLFKSFYFQGEINNDSRTYYNESLLQVAIIFKSKSIIKFLLDNGYDINRTNKFYTSSIHYAFKYGDAEILELLIANGAALNKRDSLDALPIDYSFFNEDINFINYLCDYSFYKDLKIFGNKRLAYAFIENSRIFEILKILVIKKIINVYDNIFKDVNILSLILRYEEDLVLTKFLFDNYIDVNKELFKGYSPLNYAVSLNNKELIKYLIHKGAKINSKSNSGRSILRNSVSWSDYETFIDLINCGAEIGDDDKFIVANAIRHNKLDILKYMVNNGFDLNQKLAQFTSLHNALLFNQDELIKYVLDNSNVNYYNSNKIPILLETTHNKNEKLTLKLLKLGFDPNITHKKSSPLANAIINRFSIETVELLITHKANLEFRDKLKRTPAHLAILTNNIDVLKLIEKNGGNIRSRLNFLFTSEQVARRNGFIEIERYLSKHK